MRRSAMFLLATAAVFMAPAVFAAANWVQGTNYFLVQPSQPTNVGPGKVEVTEVFSYEIGRASCRERV